jgi:RNA polymerase sigma-70 factor (ECF subfamily)
MSDTTLRLQGCLDRLRAGDEAARRDLFDVAGDRLRRLAHKMFRADDRLRRWEETGDVFQNAALRLWQALPEVAPGSLRDFFRLAALHIRRELIDLARHHYGPAGAAAHHDSPPPSAGDHGTADFEPADTSREPDRLARWAEFHQQIGNLPEEGREVFDLLWYQGLTHAEAAALLGVSTKTVQRRWHAACVRLHDALGGETPEL